MYLFDSLNIAELKFLESNYWKVLLKLKNYEVSHTPFITVCICLNIEYLVDNNFIFVITL